MESPLTAEMLSVIERYLSYGWRFGVFTSLINRQFDTAYSAPALEKLYRQTKKQSSREC